MKNGLSMMDAFRIMGPAFLVSVALVDPGNWATAIEAGSRFGYELVWVVVASNLVAILLQTLAARLGIVSGKHLAQVCRESYPPQVCALLWVLCEISIVALDLTMLLGTAIGLNLLLGWPLLPCILMTALDALLLVLLVPAQGVKKSEALTVGLLAVVVACFLVDLGVSRPPLRSVVGGLMPRLRRDSLYTAVSLLGANVMPHNFYLHSALVAGQAQRGAGGAGGPRPSVRALCLYNFLDIGAALGVALVINVAVLLVSAATFHSAGVVVHTLQDAHDLMEQTLSSSLAPAAFGTALLCAGQLSTFTGTIAGQVVLQGFLNIHISTWLRRLITRTAAIIPAAVLQYVYGDRGTYKFLLTAQVVLALQLPVTLVPLIKATSSRQLMGPHASSRLLAAAAWGAAGLVFVANLMLFVTTMLPHVSPGRGILDKDGPLDVWVDRMAVLVYREPLQAAGLVALLVAAAAFLALQLWMIITPLRVVVDPPGAFAANDGGSYGYGSDSAWYGSDDRRPARNARAQQQQQASAPAPASAAPRSAEAAEKPYGHAHHHKSAVHAAAPNHGSSGFRPIDPALLRPFAAPNSGAEGLPGGWAVPRSAIELVTASGPWRYGSPAAAAAAGRAGTAAAWRPENLLPLPWLPSEPRCSSDSEEDGGLASGRAASAAGALDWYDSGGSGTASPGGGLEAYDRAPPGAAVAAAGGSTLAQAAGARGAPSGVAPHVPPVVSSWEALCESELAAAGSGALLPLTSSGAMEPSLCCAPAVLAPRATEPASRAPPSAPQGRDSGRDSGGGGRLPHPVTRGQRRQFALLLDEFWAGLYDAHGNAAAGTAEAQDGGRSQPHGQQHNHRPQQQQHASGSSGGAAGGGWGGRASRPSTEAGWGGSGAGGGSGRAGAAPPVAGGAGRGSPLVCSHTDGSHLCMGCSQALFGTVRGCVAALERLEGAAAALWGPWPLQLLPQGNQTYHYHRAVLLAARNADFASLQALCGGTYSSTLDHSRLLASTPIAQVTPAAALPGAWAAGAAAGGPGPEAWAAWRAPERAEGGADEAGPGKRQRHSGDRPPHPQQPHPQQPHPHQQQQQPQQQSWWGAAPAIELTPVPAPSPAPSLRHTAPPHSPTARRSGAGLDPGPHPHPHPPPLAHAGSGDAGLWLPLAADPPPAPPAPPTLSCWCLFGPAVLVSFGVWCSFTLVQWCGVESRPELWGRYAAVLNKLQGVLVDTQLDVAAAAAAQQGQHGPGQGQQGQGQGLAGASGVGRASGGGGEGGRAGAWGGGSQMPARPGWPASAQHPAPTPAHHPHHHHRGTHPQQQQQQQQQPPPQPQRAAAGGPQPCLPPTALRLCPEHLALLRWELLQQLAALEGGLGERHGPADTAAGDVAFPKGKEIIASVMRRYRRRLGGGGAAAAAGGGAGVGPAVGLWGGASAALRAAVLPSIVSLATIACVVLMLPPGQQGTAAAHDPLV